MSRILTSIVGAVVEAAQELRIHRGRVILSLIGVGVAVCALTSMVGMSSLAAQAQTESQERYGGRPATLMASAYGTGTEQPDPEAYITAVHDLAERYGIGYVSQSGSTQLNVQFADGTVPVQSTVVDVPYGEMHRIRLDEGAWFQEDDGDRLAPAIVVNPAFWQRLGSPPIETHPTVTVHGEHPVTAVIVGVYASNEWDTEPQLSILPAGTALIGPVSGAEEGMGQPGQLPQFEFWVPNADAEAFTQRIQSDLRAELGDAYGVDVFRNDFGQTGEDPLLSLKLVVGAVAGLILLLGALGLINLSLVTVRQRIREIGIRRSFGATAPRVFFAVMMESVVATFVAGVIGVMLAVAVVKSPIVEQFIGQGLVTDFPPFPIEAAVLGLVSATAVGAIAGLLPALVAVRVKVIDAIRY
ncbi:ABC transporter permease [Plantibacter flavus]|uniref:ABC transporter permease n=1 Tax=Plantibacter flavus TaxID=150123 RepID=UPI002378A45C|nr:ABC transporter permease [Plantibacter flavus]MDD9154470.1 ABC transporter permease [Plantibacter flavus]